MMTAKTTTVLDVANLSKTFHPRRRLLGRSSRPVPAVDSVTFSLQRGRTLAIVGESGSGKSTTARLITQLEKADTGSVTVCGTEWSTLSEAQLRAHRADLQMIFQDPFSSLDPMRMVVHLVGEPLMIRQRMSGRQLDERVAGLLQQVGLSPRHIHRYPHEFSGGQRQRIAIARALAADPKVIIADEAVSALDVSTQAQVLNLLRDIQRDRGVAMLFISHDLGVIRQVADDIAVMFHGRIVESGPADQIFNSPADPYTKSLLAAVPEIDPAKRRPRVVLGDHTDDKRRAPTADAAPDRTRN